MASVADNKRIGDVISARSKLSPEEAANLFTTQQTKDARWAVQKGIVHEVRDLSIPPSSAVVSLVFQR